jgi:hypothetical protein
MSVSIRPLTARDAADVERLYDQSASRVAAAVTPDRSRHEWFASEASNR